MSIASVIAAIRNHPLGKSWSAKSMTEMGEAIDTEIASDISSAVATGIGAVIGVRTAADATAVTALDAAGAVGDLAVAIDSGVLYVHDGTNFKAVTMA